MSFWYIVKNIFGTFTLVDVLDIAIMSFLIYQLIKLVRETRAAQLIKGIAILLVIYLLAKAIELKTMMFLMENILQIGFLSLVVVFQPELRRALEQVGRSRIGKLQVFGAGLIEQETYAAWQKFINALVEKVPALSRQKIGALIVIERNTKLGDIIDTGTIINSDASSELIGNIFFPKSPLHDGALIVRDGRLYAAGCFLPLSDNSQISKELGTRHRAALGMSEASDALIVVVSEETGLISVCQNGKLERGFSAGRLKELLMSTLLQEKNAMELPNKKLERGEEQKEIEKD
jgi:diadenylate cyclase